MKRTLVASLKTAAAMARQRSTSRPVQLPCASGWPKPARPVFEPQVRKPFCFTLLSVAWAEAPVASRLAVRPKAIDTRAFFMFVCSPNSSIRLDGFWFYPPAEPRLDRSTPPRSRRHRNPSNSMIDPRSSLDGRHFLPDLTPEAARFQIG